MTHDDEKMRRDNQAHEAIFSALQVRGIIPAELIGDRVYEYAGEKGLLELIRGLLEMDLKGLEKVAKKLQK